MDQRLRVADAADAPLLGRMLAEFNAEYGETEPSAATIAGLAAGQLADGSIAALFIAGDPSDGFAQLRFRTSLYADGLDACLEELWVRPSARGRGLGRALLLGAMSLAADRGATRIDLNTTVADVAARSLYASAGFTNDEGGPGGPSMLYYERDLDGAAR